MHSTKQKFIFLLTEFDDLFKFVVLLHSSLSFTFNEEFSMTFGTGS